MDFAAMFQSWVNVLTHPGEVTFVEESQKPQARLATAIIWIIIAAAIAAVFSAISAIVGNMLGGGMAGLGALLNEADLPPEMRAQLARMMAGGGAGALSAFCFTLILAPIGFLIGSGIYYLIARLFGGTGTFEQQSYLLATFTAPLTILSALLSIIPILGSCLAVLLSIYQLVLTYFAIKVAHALTSGKAVAVILIPILVIFLCVICAVGVTMFAIFSAAGNQ